MPLEMPATDDKPGKCGLPSLKTNADGACNKPGVDRIAVTTADNDDDYNYEYSSEFRAVGSGWPVMVGRCQDHKDLHASEFEDERVRIEKREAKQAKEAEEIRELEEQLRAKKAAYTGTWRD